MKMLLIYLFVGVGFANISACNSVPAVFSPLPNMSNSTTLKFPQYQGNIIDNTVISALNQRHEVPVIIELRPPLSVVPETLSAEERTRKIDMTQELVLNTLTQGEFRLKYRSGIIFMMAGWITMQGVVTLSRNQHVVKVSLDSVSRNSIQ